MVHVGILLRECCVRENSASKRPDPAIVSVRVAPLQNSAMGKESGVEASYLSLNQILTVFFDFFF